MLPGLVSGADLAAYSATWEAPALMDWQGVQVAKTGLWGQGPSLLQALAILDRLGPEALDPGTEAGMHAVGGDLEARDGRPGGVVRRPLAAHRRRPAGRGLRRGARALVGHDADQRAAPGLPRRPRAAPGRARAPAAGRRSTGRTADVTTGEPTVQRDGTVRGDTCHIDVVDRWGNMISATPSGGWLQSSPTIPELGFCLGSRAQMFWLDEGLPASLEPGARPRTTLSPTLVLRDGEPVLACGTPGGDQQDQWQSLFLLRHVVGGMSLQEAIDAPMFHSTSFPGSFHPRAMETGVLVTEDRVDPRCSPGSPPAATRWSRRARGRWDGCARSPATRAPACSLPVPTRAACRGTPSVAELPTPEPASPVELPSPVEPVETPRPSAPRLRWHHHGAERERLGPVALHLQRAAEHAPHRAQLAGGQP